MLQISQWENLEMREWGNLEIREWENGEGWGVRKETEGFGRVRWGKR